MWSPTLNTDASLYIHQRVVHHRQSLDRHHAFARLDVRVREGGVLDHHGSRGGEEVENVRGVTTTERGDGLSQLQRVQIQHAFVEPKKHVVVREDAVRQRHVALLLTRRSPRLTTPQRTTTSSFSPASSNTCRISPFVRSTLHTLSHAALAAISILSFTTTLLTSNRPSFSAI